MEKGEVSIVDQEPRLFIKSPSYFLNISKVLHELDLDESTSVYVKDHTYVEETVEEEDVVKDVQVDPYLLKQLQFLEKPFRQRAYQPLLVCLKDGRKLTGSASDVQNDSLMLTSLELKTQEIIYFEDIKQVLWRGRQLPTL
ncbi:hypothetical protein J2D69_03505 [Lysinibacillus sphaericus]|uniref:Uncharacterized protein n=2 Tax=Lysinibacillus sphaericus TaxID=1421 RepID=B1HNY7_LYSSC|nr:MULTISPECIES: hypothetical protein [Lysinibacillus]ACA38839.1 hypothetical protein Bsph_1231 [Lysinibacillus sphaericus C3-41]MBE5084834.1 hypothetical protein [Bacillus thuringiensis]AMO34912.1 hypothetical protein AR327_21995 [Lysinibacillus sphaericus]AMR89973.1 hypothetical protein A1T07_07215 [Lysinibacillus sphaericus]ANA48043.1 hypothetical protein A2J09_22415 [Lysinibacillus sphaericus]